MFAGGWLVTALTFSCKGRGVCPSCNAKRAHVTAAHLVERVLPHVPYRRDSALPLAGGVPRALTAAAAALDGGGRAAPSPKATPVRRAGGLLPACQHAPSRQRQAGPGAAVPLRGARCAGAGAFVTSGGRPHRLANEAPAARRHHAPALHRAGTVTACGVPGACASGEPHEVSWRQVRRRRTWRAARQVRRRRVRRLKQRPARSR